MTKNKNNDLESSDRNKENNIFESRSRSEIDSDSDREVIDMDSSSIAGRTRSALSASSQRLWRKRAVESGGSDVESLKSCGSKRGRSRVTPSSKSKKVPVITLEKCETEKAADTVSVHSNNTKSGLEGDSSSEDERSANTLLAEGIKYADAVKNIAVKSTNIKGDLRRDLKVAAVAFKKIAKVLSRRTANEEVRKLQTENNHLRQEIDCLRKEWSALKESMTKNKEKSPPRQQILSPTNFPLEELQRTIMVSVGTMLNARLESLEDRLLPAKQIRPSLGKKAAVAIPAAMGDRAPTSSSSNPQPLVVEKKTKKIKQKKDPKKKMETQQNEAVDKTTWATVVRRSKKAAPSETASSKTPQTVQQKKAPEKAPNNKNGAKIKKLRPPRSSAVILTLQSGAEEVGHSYSSILAQAKKAIGSLNGLGISGGVRCRTAATGARILELLGAQTSDQADKLAEKIREVLPAQYVKVDRPVKCANLRISGLDDSVSSAEIITAVATAGGCTESSVKVGPIRASTSGTGSTRVTCPVATCNKLATVGRLLVGWSSAKVVLLEARPMRCYRCLEAGHVGIKCSSTVNRSGECFRCGLTGHKAADCSAAPHCSLCAAEGKKADHKVGAKTCAYLRKRKAKKATTPLAAAHSAATEGQQTMVVE